MSDAMEPASLDNDTRGWIMCLVSGIACVVGASIIYVDLLICRLPGKRDFRIQDSNVFLACALSLSFGVMQFSALYSMLPEAKSYLKEGGYSDQIAGAILMGCFIGGFVGIQAVSRVLHQFMPSHVVDLRSHPRRERNTAPESLSRKTSFARQRPPLRIHKHDADERRWPWTMAMTMDTLTDMPPSRQRSRPRVDPAAQHAVRGRQCQACIGETTDHETDHAGQDGGGPCFGYTDPCGQECFKHLGSRSAASSRHSTVVRPSTGHFPPTSSGPHSREREEDMESIGSPASPRHPRSRTASREPLNGNLEEADTEVQSEDCSSMEEDVEAQHHHHVPTNAFLSLGLQTSIAIALHKFPEGFITYATNHANPSLGFSVFMALFVHNISEGFAMALPLYMALGSRLRALLWSSLLGGLSQPLGAAIAVLWFRIANHTHMAPSAVAYACMFAVTAGIMVSVALQLFVEALCLDHNRNLCIFFGFLGMALLGVSSAIASAH
ncbi:vacuolar membrane zinc transporter [Verticillium alfalfae VaMs.102]|uniref:Vacuolar membrane zinc transporter n=1 Tax=Verticillium alfalfae (strain VaMs.102 / ATCC MYA-4576 / FGSC 10136) TaxID=526221 RepID=C9SV64_VERA1|nr:vacuolar membrane zinc transporter [Verticillium alfalfae VaMs.102]EEY22679.1 vacuolar membrane zinc transporter [Verticillium alfalfae VaMs.102]